MFTRQPATPPSFSATPQSLDAIRSVPKQGETAGNGMAGGAPSFAPQASAPDRRHTPTSSTLSIISSDLTIIGQGLRIVTRGTLQVDGRVDGDVVGNEVIIGESGRVTGIVSGQSVVVRGEVSGTVKGLQVELKSSAKVDGEVHHQQLTVEQGAQLDGRVRRPQNIDELTPVLE